MPATIRSAKKRTSRKGLILLSFVFMATPGIQAAPRFHNLSLSPLCQDAMWRSAQAAGKRNGSGLLCPHFLYICCTCRKYLSGIPARLRKRDNGVFRPPCFRKTGRKVLRKATYTSRSCMSEIFFRLIRKWRQQECYRRPGSNPFPTGYPSLYISKLILRKWIMTVLSCCM